MLVLFDDCWMLVFGQMMDVSQAVLTVVSSWDAVLICSDVCVGFVTVVVVIIVVLFGGTGNRVPF